MMYDVTVASCPEFQKSVVMLEKHPHEEHLRLVQRQEVKL